MNANSLIPYGRHSVSESDIEAVERVLRSDWLTQGRETPAFEQALADRCEAPYAVATNSATSALHLACLALGLGPGDTLWTSPVTFAASANGALYCGAKVAFVDIEPETGLLCPRALERKLRAARQSGALPKIVVPVHLAGQSCDMAALAALADEYGFYLLEDAAHALGGSYRDRPVGGCEHSAIAVFSFHPVKSIACGEGGMATTRDPELAERMALLRTHGITRDQACMGRAAEGDWDYDQIALGFNYRLSDIHAALGRSQLARLDDFVARRRALAERYDVALADLPLAPLVQRADRTSAWHLYVVRLRGADSAERRDALLAGLRARGIGATLHYRPVFALDWHRARDDGSCPEAVRYGRDALTLPLFPELTEEQQDRVVACLRELLS